MVINEMLKNEFPFQPHYLQHGPFKQHYVDEGQGEPILCLHGNPTWSFYYRNIVKAFSSQYRVIAPDHIGCGLSSRPQDWSYNLEGHINHIEALVDHLGIKNITLVLHDWGGAIGMGLATRRPELIKKIILTNTAAFRSQNIPWRIALCKSPIFGGPMVQAFNAFAWPATFMAVKKPLSKIVKKGYLFPYNNYANRIATARFVKDIPLSKNHPSYQTLMDIELKLKNIKCPVLILWGEADFCFNMKFFNRWSEFIPHALTRVYPGAGHYLFEDRKDETIQEIANFLECKQ